MVRTLPPRKTTFAPAGERRRLKQIRLAQQRAELVEVRRRAAESVAAADAKLGAVDREIAIVLAAASMSGSSATAQKAAVTRSKPTRKAKPSKATAKNSAAMTRGRRRPANTVASGNAVAPTPGSTSHTIAVFLARRPSHTFTPSEIRDATGINTALVMKTLQRMHARGQVLRIDKGVYRIAGKN